MITLSSLIIDEEEQVKLTLTVHTSRGKGAPRAVVIGDLSGGLSMGTRQLSAVMTRQAPELKCLELVTFNHVPTVRFNHK